MWKIKEALGNTFIGHYYLLLKEYRSRDREIDLLSILCRPRSKTIDVGAAQGFYTHFILKNSTHCHAFEANPERASRLKKIFSSKKVTVYHSALSNKEGMVSLRIPIIGGKAFYGRGTIETDNSFDAKKMITYELNMEILDKLFLNDIGFMKIDVEGHELAVLEGADDLSSECKPNLLIEAEDRHRKHAVSSIDNFLSLKGYRGFFILDNKLISIKEFNTAIHQSKNGLDDSGSEYYVNNFIFTCDDSVESKLKSFFKKKSYFSRVFH